MNSLLKINRKSVSLLTAHLLKKPSKAFSSKNYSMSQNIKPCFLIGKSSAKFYSFPHFKFSDGNKDNDKNDKSNEDKKEQEDSSHPKGFGKFYKKKIFNKNSEPSKESQEEKGDKEQPEQKEKKNDNENENDKSDEGVKDEKNNKENEKSSDKKKQEEMMELMQTLFNQNSGLVLAAIFTSAYIIYNILFAKSKSGVKEVTVNEFNTFLESKQIQNIEITKDRNTSTFFNVIAFLKDNRVIKLTILNHEVFLKTLESKQFELGFPEKEFIPIKITGLPSVNLEETDTRIPIIAIGILIGLGFRLNTRWQALLKKKNPKNSTGADSFKDSFGGLKNFNFFDVAKSNAKEFGVENKVNVRFKNVAGMAQPKKEIMEFVDFLKKPEKYQKLGAKIPRGALLVGPPGTGKTMLAKAVAGEAGVPFFAISGSDFVEMFVGVGASRVRDLFKKAKDKAPSIIFIDEIDAVGRKRGGKYTGGHDERDNTLNQLLVEMDGFGTDSSVIVLAATNRADVLDNALLRPGRFDRQVEVSLPDRKDREEIFKIYLKKIKTDKSKTIQEYAVRLSTLTPGFSGADISNLVNEAAIISARNDKESVDSESFEQASDRIIAGLETRRLLSEKERKIVAYHECGHAVVGWFLENSQPLVKLTIIPRSKGALGFTQFVPDDVQLRSKEHLVDLICGLLGGRMAEEKFFGQITTGASDDLQKVRNIAHAMVTKYGMSRLGLAAYPGGEEEYVKPYSTQTENVFIFYFRK
jgi:AFG3 family protein